MKVSGSYLRCTEDDYLGNYAPKLETSLCKHCCSSHTGVNRDRSAETGWRIAGVTTQPLLHSASLQTSHSLSRPPRVWYCPRWPRQPSHTWRSGVRPPALEACANLSPCLDSDSFPQRSCWPLDFAASHIWTDKSGSRTEILKPKPRGTSTVKQFLLWQPMKLHTLQGSPLLWNSSPVKLVFNGFFVMENFKRMATS